MLRNIPPVMSPELLKTIHEMGHSDFIIIADANFPASDLAKRYIRLDGVESTDLLDAILRFFPLDDFVDKPVVLMQPRLQEPEPEIWQVYQKIIHDRDEEKIFSGFHSIDRLDFYEYAKKAYAIVQTGTTVRYANISIQKGVI